MEGQNFSSYSPLAMSAAQTAYSPMAYAACTSVVRTPASTSGIDHPRWVEQYRDPTLSDAVQLNAFKGMACERTANGPARDDQYFSVIVEQRPVFQLPPPVTEQSDAVPAVFQSQVGNSCGFDIGYDQIWVSQDYSIFCGANQPK